MNKNEKAMQSSECMPSLYTGSDGYCFIPLLTCAVASRPFLGAWLCGQVAFPGLTLPDS